MVSGLRGRRAVIAKLGFDAHWRGAILVASALRDAGMEVIYLGHATAEQIARAAIQEDAALVGLSTLSGNHLEECPLVVDELRALGGSEVLVVVGGTIPPTDAQLLMAAGADGIFPTGTSVPDLVARIEELVSRLAAPTMAADVKEGSG